MFLVINVPMTRNPFRHARSVEDLAIASHLPWVKSFLWFSVGLQIWRVGYQPHFDVGKLALKLRDSTADS